MTEGMTGPPKYTDQTPETPQFRYASWMYRARKFYTIRSIRGVGLGVLFAYFLPRGCC